MGPLPSFYNNKYILVAVDNVSNWVESSTLPINHLKAGLFQSIYFRVMLVLVHLVSMLCQVCYGPKHLCVRVVFMSSTCSARVRHRLFLCPC